MPTSICAFRLLLPARRPRPELALTPVHTSTELASTPEGAMIKLVINLPLQARLTCVRACTRPSTELVLRPPSMTRGESGLRPHHQGERHHARRTRRSFLCHA